jgi:hypothetical protein
MNRLVLRAQVSPAVHQIVWLVDSETYALADPAAPLYWPTSPGVHRFQIRLPLQRGESPCHTRGCAMTSRDQTQVEKPFLGGLTMG